MAGYTAVVAAVEVDENVRVRNVWCAADGGLVINPDGAINRLEGGISWALKEGVRLDTAGIGSRDGGKLPGPALQGGAGAVRGADQPAHRSTAAWARGSDRRPDRRADRQRGRAGAWRADTRAADDAGASHGGTAPGSKRYPIGLTRFRGMLCAPFTSEVRNEGKTYHANQHARRGDLPLRPPRLPAHGRARRSAHQSCNDRASKREHRVCRG